MELKAETHVVDFATAPVNAAIKKIKADKKITSRVSEDVRKTITYLVKRQAYNTTEELLLLSEHQRGQSLPKRDTILDRDLTAAISTAHFAKQFADDNYRNNMYNFLKQKK